MNAQTIATKQSTHEHTTRIRTNTSDFLMQAQLYRFRRQAGSRRSCKPHSNDLSVCSTVYNALHFCSKTGSVVKTSFFLCVLFAWLVHIISESVPECHFYYTNNYGF